MPHSRSRTALKKLLRKLRFSPVVAIQGARQTGKSFLARELLKAELPHSKYISFDQQSYKSSAIERPHSFLAEYGDASPLIIDEAQKVPEIFDAIKYEVDQKRRPGKFLLLGSTEFSKLTFIRESLTGRMSRIRLFPLTIAESLGGNQKNKVHVISRSQVLHYLKFGGMPGIFAVRDHEERDSLYQDWIDLTCLRDIQQFKTLKLDGELTYSILRQTALLEEPSRAHIASALKIDSRRISTHINALCELFVLQKLSPHPSGTGKAIYLPLDTGIAHYLGASLKRCLHIMLMNERLCLNSYSTTQKRKSFFYYRSTGKRIVHLIEESLDEPLRAFQVIEQERIKKTDAELMLSFLKKNQGARGEVFAPLPESQKINHCNFSPWEKILAE